MPGFADFAGGVGDERLPAKAGVDCHQQNQVGEGEEMRESGEGCRRVESDAASHSGGVDGGGGAVGMTAGFGVEGEAVRAGFGEGGDERIHGFGHQVGVQKGVRRLRVLAQGAAGECAEGEIGDIVVVHHIQVQPVGAGCEGGCGFFAESGEIRGEQTGGDGDWHSGAVGVL